MSNSFRSASVGAVILLTTLRWCRRLALFAVGLVLAACALFMSMLLLAFVSVRAVALRFFGRANRSVHDVRPTPQVFRRGLRVPSRQDVVDVEARPLS